MNLNLESLQVIQEFPNHIMVYEVQEAHQDESNGLITVRLTGNKVMRISDNIEK